MLVSTTNYEITWEKLPDDFVLDDEPGDNINYQLLNLIPLRQLHSEITVARDGLVQLFDSLGL
jgi:hypothetical protein